MVELFCTPFVEMIERMRLEMENQQTIFDLPVRKWYIPQQESSDLDCSVPFHDRRAGNPCGPASGPQTQMAQNLVLSWLAGGRIMELKTVQLNDRLSISRPCIDATNIGYNIEWSQELRVEQSLDQYVQGAMLIHMLRKAPEVFADPFGHADMSGPVGEPIYDMSIGYDLAGIQSEKIGHFVRGMIDATESVERLRAEIPHRLTKLRDLDYPTALSRSITLSTFHGCPADEIERICQYLLTEFDVHVIVKMNPPMLGKERLEQLLHDQMGYAEIRVNPAAYTGGLLFDESLEICGRLDQLAKSRNLGFGAKFSNTLEVTNHRTFFAADEKVMYLSGQPLHVITLTLADKFRQAMGFDLPISFSAGVDRKNFANLVACGFVPITTCTDLLRVGGYGRLPPYLQELAKAMRAVGATNLNDYVLDARGQREAAGGNPVRAGFLNTPIIVAETQADPHYHALKNSAQPKKIDSHLTTFDCITCDKCIPVCPNGANFAYHTGKVEFTYRDVEVGADGSVQPIGDEQTFRLEQQEQIANFADYCNHCGNCDTFCPEYDGPYLKKPTFFGSRQAFEEGAPHDGFYLQGSHGRLELGNLEMVGRIDTHVYHLQQLEQPDGYRFHDGKVTLLITPAGQIDLDPTTATPSTAHRTDMGRFHALVTLLNSITDSSRIHAVNAHLLTSPGAT
ncbi:MAG: 4Fe-4S dicluster domain-containing protein [Pirellulales bacterium]